MRLFLLNERNEYNAAANDCKKFEIYARNIFVCLFMKKWKKTVFSAKEFQSWMFSARVNSTHA